MKNCLFCVHFVFESGAPDYSEYTPGHDIDIHCGRQKWAVDVIRTTQAEFERYMTSAFTCPEYSRRRPKDTVVLNEK